MNLTKLYRICFILSVVSFLLFFLFLFLFTPNDTAAWRAFSIFMPISGGAMGLGLLLWVISLLKK